MKPGMACQVVPEPVDKWQNIQASNGGEPANLLEAFYKEPSRFAYTFQNYVFVTRLMQVCYFGSIHIAMLNRWAWKG